MDSLREENWPSFGQGNHSPASIKLHAWCGKISLFVLSLSERVLNLEKNELINLNEIKQLKSDLTNAISVKTSNIRNDWVEIASKGTQNKKKPAEQLIVANATINEMNERDKRKKNIIVYGVPESTLVDFTDKKAEDMVKIKDILNKIEKSDVNPNYIRRLKSKDSAKPGPILVELSDSSIRNPVLLAAKKLRNFDNYKSVYNSPDLTEAERQMDYELRKERNRLNESNPTDSPFRYGIRGNQVQRFKNTL